MSIHWIITFGDNARVLSQAETEAKTVSELKDALQISVCLTAASR